MAPRTDPNNPLNIPAAMIYGTAYTNSTEGVNAFRAAIVAGAVANERDRVAGDARRARGDYGIELGNADEALRLINRLEFPDQPFDDAISTIERAIQTGFSGDEYVADRLDEMVDSFTTYAQDLTIQLQNLAATAYTIRHGVEPADDWTHTEGSKLP